MTIIFCFPKLVLLYLILQQINITKNGKTVLNFLCTCKSSLTVTSSGIPWDFINHEMYEMWDYFSNLNVVIDAHDYIFVTMTVACDVILTVINLPAGR